MKLTRDDIIAKIIDIDYCVFPGTQLTVCVLTLENGFTVTGESACADPDEFNAQTGRNVSSENAMQKIWQLEGYLLKQRMYEAQNGTAGTEDTDTCDPT